MNLTWFWDGLVFNSFLRYKTLPQGVAYCAFEVLWVHVWLDLTPWGICPSSEYTDIIQLTQFNTYLLSADNIINLASSWSLVDGRLSLMYQSLRFTLLTVDVSGWKRLSLPYQLMVMALSLRAISDTQVWVISLSDYFSFEVHRLGSLSQPDIHN